jgi:hypothetical protein
VADRTEDLDGEQRAGFKPPRRVPPPSQRALLDVVNRYAEYHGIAPNRVQRWIAFMALGGALSRLSGEAGDPLFLIKGGVSLELRLRLRARATKDFDAAFRGERDAVIGALEQAFTEPYEGFTFRIGGEPREMTHMTRFEIKVEYEGRVWSSITMEVSAYEGTDLPAEEVPAISLTDFGLRGPERLPCMPLVKQVAQKLHAMTEQLESGHPNERFRDLWDLWVLREMVPPSPQLREVCEETFRIREKHPWPPTILVHSHWIEPFAALAQGEGLLVPDAQQAGEDVREYVRSIVDA